MGGRKAGRQAEGSTTVPSLLALYSSRLRDTETQGSHSPLPAQLLLEPLFENFTFQLSRISSLLRKYVLLSTLVGGQWLNQRHMTGPSAER